MLLPDGINVNRSLVKEVWCSWYRKYAPRDTALEGLDWALEDNGFYKTKGEILLIPSKVQRCGSLIVRWRRAPVT